MASQTLRAAWTRTKPASAQLSEAQARRRRWRSGRSHRPHEAVRLALDAGQKLGDIPGAPPPLARFANAAPPTEAGLRLAFPQAAQSALAAARPAAEGKPLLARIGPKRRISSPSGRAITSCWATLPPVFSSRARTDLEAGDLAGAVDAVAALTGAPAQSMAAWLAGARALLEARAALTEWATRA